MEAQALVMRKKVRTKVCIPSRSAAQLQRIPASKSSAQLCRLPSSPTGFYRQPSPISETAISFDESLEDTPRPAPKLAHKDAGNGLGRARAASCEAALVSPALSVQKYAPTAEGRPATRAAPSAPCPRPRGTSPAPTFEMKQVRVPSRAQSLGIRRAGTPAVGACRPRPRSPQRCGIACEVLPPSPGVGKGAARPLAPLSPVYSSVGQDQTLDDDDFLELSETQGNQTSCIKEQSVTPAKQGVQKSPEKAQDLEASHSAASDDDNESLGSFASPQSRGSLKTAPNSPSCIGKPIDDAEKSTSHGSSGNPSSEPTLSSSRGPDESLKSSMRSLSRSLGHRSLSGTPDEARPHSSRDIKCAMGERQLSARSARRTPACSSSRKTQVDCEKSMDASYTELLDTSLPLQSARTDRTQTPIVSSRSSKPEEGAHSRAGSAHPSPAGSDAELKQQFPDESLRSARMSSCASTCAKRLDSSVSRSIAKDLPPPLCRSKDASSKQVSARSERNDLVSPALSAVQNTERDPSLHLRCHGSGSAQLCTPSARTDHVSPVRAPAHNAECESALRLRSIVPGGPQASTPMIKTPNQAIGLPLPPSRPPTSTPRAGSSRPKPASGASSPSISASPAAGSRAASPSAGADRRPHSRRSKGSGGASRASSPSASVHEHCGATPQSAASSSSRRSSTPVGLPIGQNSSSPSAAHIKISEDPKCCSSRMASPVRKQEPPSASSRSHLHLEVDSRMGNESTSREIVKGVLEEGLVGPDSCRTIQASGPLGSQSISCFSPSSFPTSVSAAGGLPPSAPTRGASPAPRLPRSEAQSSVQSPASWYQSPRSPALSGGASLDSSLIDEPPHHGVSSADWYDTEDLMLNEGRSFAA